MKPIFATTAALGFFLVASTATAATVVESFEEPTFSNGASQESVTSQNFVYEPVKTISGQCYEGALCITEVSGNPDVFPDGTITNISYEYGTYDFLGVYVNYNGNTSPETNFFDIYINDLSGTGDSDFSLTGTSAAGSDGLAAVWEVPNNDPTNLNQLETGEFLTFDATGYILIFDPALFNDVTTLSIFSDLEGSFVMDCAFYWTGDGTYEGNYSELTGCAPTPPPPNEVPVPAAGWLLLAGLGGLAALRKRA